MNSLQQGCQLLNAVYPHEVSEEVIIHQVQQKSLMDMTCQLLNNVSCEDPPHHQAE